MAVSGAPSCASISCWTCARSAAPCCCAKWTSCALVQRQRRQRVHSKSCCARCSAYGAGRRCHGAQSMSASSCMQPDTQLMAARAQNCSDRQRGGWLLSKGQQLCGPH